MRREHLGIALALNVPVMVVITKIDICPPHILEQTISQLTKILKSPGARKIPVYIRNRQECIDTAVRPCPGTAWQRQADVPRRRNSSANGYAPSSRCPT